MVPTLKLLQLHLDYDLCSGQKGHTLTTLSRVLIPARGKKRKQTKSNRNFERRFCI